MRGVVVALFLVVVARRRVTSRRVAVPIATHDVVSFVCLSLVRSIDTPMERETSRARLERVERTGRCTRSSARRSRSFVRSPPSEERAVVNFTFSTASVLLHFTTFRVRAGTSSRSEERRTKMTIQRFFDSIRHHSAHARLSASTRSANALNAFTAALRLSRTSAEP